MKSFTLQQLAEQLDAKLIGDGKIVITHLAPLDQATEGAISFLADSKYHEVFKNTKASAVMVSEEFASQCPSAALVMADPYYGFAKMAALFNNAPRPSVGIDPRAAVAKSAKIAPEVSIAAGCVIADDVVIGAGSVLRANVVVEEGVVIGKQTTLHPNVTIYHHCVLGDHVEVHANSVIGSDGFGNARDKNGRWIKIPQLGRVVIGNHVEIGASTTIDRGALGDTIIHDNARLDNQIQIAHNVEIGEGTAMAACTGVAGSTKIGKHCMIGGAVGIVGHIEICDQVGITAQSGISKSITEPGVYSASMPALPVKKWMKLCAWFRKLDQLAERVKKVEQELK